MKKTLLLFYTLVLAAMIPASAFDLSKLDTDKISVPKPTASIKSFDIEAITLRDITLKFNVIVKNPFPISLKLKGVKLKFSVEGKQFFETEASRGFRIKSRGSAENIFLVNLKYSDIIAIIKDYTNKEYLDTIIDTEIILPIPKSVQNPPMIPDSLSFKSKLSKRIPAIKPHISIANFSVQEPSLDEVKAALKKAGKQAVDPNKAISMISGIISGKKTSSDVVDISKLDLKLKVNFDIELKNDAKAKLSFSSLDYDFLINSSPLVNGSTSKIQMNGDKQILTVSNAFSTRALAGPVLAAFKQRKGAFIVKGNTRIQLPRDVKEEPVKLSFSEGGDFKLN